MSCNAMGCHATPCTALQVNQQGYAIEGEERGGFGVLPQQHAERLRPVIRDQKTVDRVPHQLHPLLDLPGEQEVLAHAAHRRRSERVRGRVHVESRGCGAGG